MLISHFKKYTTTKQVRNSTDSLHHDINTHPSSNLPHQAFLHPTALLLPLPDVPQLPPLCFPPFPAIKAAIKDVPPAAKYSSDSNWANLVQQHGRIQSSEQVGQDTNCPTTLPFQSSPYMRAALILKDTPLQGSSLKCPSNHENN